jgi:two-component system, OmpR family, sensor kinase
MIAESGSIAKQLIIWLSAALFLFWLLAVGLGVSVMREEFGEIFDSSLQETAERLVPLVVDDLYLREDATTPRKLTALRGSVPDEYLTYQVRDADGRVLMHSHNVTSDPYPAPLTPGFWEDETKRIFTVSAVSSSLFVQVADSLDHRREAALEGMTALLMPILVLLPITIAAIWWIVRRALLPVDRLRAEIAMKDSGNLSPVALDGLPKEILPISQSVNVLLSRLTAALEAERELTANSAHELRTPIAGARAQVEVLLEELPEGSAREHAKRADGALRRLAALNEKLLQLSRAEAGIGAGRETNDLVPIVDMLVDEFNRSGPLQGRIRYHRGTDDHLRWPADPDAFAIVLRNLIENAGLHGLGQAPIDVFVEDGQSVRVTNASPALSDAELSHLRQRFARGNDRAPGSGLGLAIADRMVTQMGASLILSCKTRNGTDHVFHATVQFAEEAETVEA